MISFEFAIFFKALLHPAMKLWSKTHLITHITETHNNIQKYLLKTFPAASNCSTACSLLLQEPEIDPVRAPCCGGDAPPPPSQVLTAEYPLPHSSPAKKNKFG